jgi:putative hydrolase of the HAD superfamily
MALVDRFAGVIFDYGGVLASQQTEEDARHLAKTAGIDNVRFQELYWADRLAYDRGDVTGPEYWRRIGRLGGRTLDDATVQALMELDSRSWMNFMQPMYEFAARLRSGGKRVAVLSNMPHELGEAIKAQGFGFAGFDHVTLSYEVRSAKPEAQIYENCLRGIGTPAAETLFLDDRKENIEGAKALGIDGVVFSTPHEMLPRLLG